MYTKGAKTPPVPLETLQKWGAARVSVPVFPLFAATKALERAFTAIANDEARTMEDEIWRFEEFTRLVGLPEIRELERKFLDTAELDARYNR